jgi:hypothetical protein
MPCSCSTLQRHPAIRRYSVYKKLAAPSRLGGPVTLAYCWSHLRRQFHEVYVGGNAPIATVALARIKLLYDIEAEIRGLQAQVRRAIRQQRSKPVVEALRPWLEASLAKVSKGSTLADALGYGLNHRNGLCRYLDDGRIEIDSNTVERSIRGLALTRKNALFAGHDRGAAGCAIIASLLETCKLNRVDPLAWTTDVLTKLVNRWPASRIDDPMPLRPRERASRWDGWPAYVQTDDAARVKIEHGRDVEPALCRPDVGEVGHPFLVGRSRCELAIQDVVGDGAANAQIFEQPSATRPGTQRLLAHQPPDAVQSAALAQCQYVVPDPTRSVGAITAHEALTNMCSQ